jgi:hypothetical protein
MTPTFLDKVVAGTATPDQIDDYVDRWHRNPGRHSLPEYLGLTPREYHRWVWDARSIYRIVDDRRA